jgi:hypothetical protein
MEGGRGSGIHGGVHRIFAVYKWLHGIRVLSLPIWRHNLRSADSNLAPNFRDAAPVLTTCCPRVVSLEWPTQKELERTEFLFHFCWAPCRGVQFHVCRQLSLAEHSAVNLRKLAATATTGSSRRCPDSLFSKLLLLVQIRQCRYSCSGIRSTSRPQKKMSSHPRNSAICSSLTVSLLLLHYVSDRHTTTPAEKSK